MSYQTYNLIGIILLSLCGLFLLISTFLFIYFRIISVIGDLTGSTAKKQIERIRDENIQSGNKRFRPSPINVKRGKLTEHVTEKIVNSKKSQADSTELLYEGVRTLSDGTEVLSDGTQTLSNETVILNEGSAAVEVVKSIMLIHTDEVIT